ncbi:MAG TPA: hypothetical protein PK513_04075 [Alphaproteobacteria bacterium]|nr:hypothetical protein [Alphaproteobacteria bacterium]USO05067.1 MAG: hypothetical protein H6859_07885 [Rhodospirillales bacterium]HOO81661.1 hypothetical protein [Alphaproteobacteria bacterium]
MLQPDLNDPIVKACVEIIQSAPQITPVTDEAAVSMCNKQRNFDPENPTVTADQIPALNANEDWNRAAGIVPKEMPSMR